ncbi:hypothetical protein ATCC90586_002783 [Pythium insidiosum]|nr:hypothetical protein ATCC90586_002783 [Pythium insidiosum]
MQDPTSTAAASSSAAAPRTQLHRAETFDGATMPRSSSFMSSLTRRLSSKKSSFHDVTSAAPPSSQSSSNSQYEDSSGAAIPRAPSSLPHVSRAAFPHASTLRDRSNSWAVTSTTMTSAASALPRAQHVMDDKSAAKLSKEITKAVKVVETFLSPKLLKDQAIPRELLIEAYGLVFITVYKVGFLFSGKIGTGFVISRTTGGWSAPSFISSGGLGFGMMAGGEVVNYMIVLNSRSSVKVFTRNGQFQLGSELDLAVGPIGRAASAALNVGRGGFAPNYSYSHSMGLYGGIGLTSAVICTRKSLNAKCYGPVVTARQILGGEIPCPQAVPLWEALDRALGVTRQYANGMPVLQPAAATGVACEGCGFVNAMESHSCSRCQGLLVYSVSVHSGKRNVGQLVVSTDHAAHASSVSAST